MSATRKSRATNSLRFLKRFLRNPPTWRCADGRGAIPNEGRVDENFSPESDLDEVQPGGRASARDSLLLQATLKRGSGEVLSVRVRNLSAGGLMGDLAGKVVPGEALKVELRGIGSVEAKVAWRTAHRVGLTFDEPVDPLLARKPVAAPKPAPARSSVPGRPGYR